MSADNYIGIRQLPDGKWAIAELSFSDYSPNMKTNAEIDNDYFTENSIRLGRFDTQREASRAASHLEDEIVKTWGYVEYGSILVHRHTPEEDSQIEAKIALLKKEQERRMQYSKPYKKLNKRR